uniref:BAR/IMD domain containing adaptor protein 2 like 2a n=1 Tax=Tetraodon nigroviridis TaxID=99883 RepID=H3D1R0_TETNG
KSRPHSDTTALKDQREQNLVDDFNPSLQKLVLLGNSYIQAFRAFTSTSDAYFGALSKIGEKALHTVSSRSLGEVLMQISESQRRFTMELEGVLQWFSVEVIRQMDNNTRQDRSFISDSRKYYEMEVHNKATALERQLWRGNSRVGRPAFHCLSVHLFSLSGQDQGEYLQFLQRSNEEALQEEERRHRFLAEKHCGLVQSITYLMNKTGSSLQQKVDSWTKDVSATREPEAEQRPSVSNSFAASLLHSHDKLLQHQHRHHNRTQVGMREDNFRMAREQQRLDREESPLGNVPSRAPSPQGSLPQALGEAAAGVGRTMRARVSHQPTASNRTLLPFSKGERITVLVPQARKGWLYGQAESSTQQGWFPASFAEAVDDPPPQVTVSRNSSNSSFSSLADQPWSRRQSDATPPPPPPLVDTDRGPPLSPLVSSEDQTLPDRDRNSSPVYFRRGTNPFATVKLKPTTTDDRSAPRL